MNGFLLLLLCGLIGAGYYAYRRLLTIEREIRADQRASDAAEEVSPVSAAVPEGTGAVAAVIKEQAAGLPEQILLAVANNPGLAQTELYRQFPAEERREIQTLLRDLDRQGGLRREKQGNSYRLYPL